MAMESINGLTTLSMMETGTTIISKDTESTDGPTTESILGTGKITRCMVEASTSGQMEGDTRDSTRMTESMALESTFGLMGRNMKVSGITANSTERVESPPSRERANLAYGKTATGLNGWMINPQSNLIMPNRRISHSRSKLSSNYLLTTSCL